MTEQRRRQQDAGEAELDQGREPGAALLGEQQGHQGETDEGVTGGGATGAGSMRGSSRAAGAPGDIWSRVSRADRAASDVARPAARTESVGSDAEADLGTPAG